jgi:2-polyprenyl-6-methoxyphenol hydroxylase-like FAD-dependent oxidoreductase
MAKIELDIIVVGAGIAGLAAAVSLSRAGHNVTVNLYTRVPKDRNPDPFLGIGEVKIQARSWVYDCHWPNRRQCIEFVR